MAKSKAASKLTADSFGDQKRRAYAWKQLEQDVVFCSRCPRLIEHCKTIAHHRRRAYLDWEYWGRPVPNLGENDSDLLVVGLAPAAHGANRTGRMFTGDRSGDWLFRALHRAGFANQPDATAVDDGLILQNCSITSICHCAPPGNKPNVQELANCHEYLLRTLRLGRPRVVLALGGMAWKSIAKIAVENDWLDSPRPRPRFEHGGLVALNVGSRSFQDRPNTVSIPGRGIIYLIGSYHPSQQNTFTGRLTEEMLDNVFERITHLLTETEQS